MNPLQYLVREFKIWRLKRRAVRAMTEYLSIINSMPCGTSLTNFLSLRASAAAKRFDETYALLHQIDPKAPKAPRLQIDLNVRSQMMPDG